jgi:hypothetical protein
MKIDASKALGAYAAATTCALAWMALVGANAPAKFQEIDVERINVREPDGTLRMVIANRVRTPGVIVEGKEHKHLSRTQAGMLFYNDEGTENGGLMFEGGMKDGKPTNVGHLSFDRWRQDQTLFLQSVEDGPRKRAGIVVQDRPDVPMDMAGISRAMAMSEGAERDAAFRAAGVEQSTRAFLGRDFDDSSQLALRDGAGRKRLVLRVDKDGAATIQFLDASGKVVRTETTP